MEGKNVRLANQQNANPYCTTAVVPNKPPQVSNCNGEQSATNPVATVVHAKVRNIKIKKKTHSNKKLKTKRDQTNQIKMSIFVGKQSTECLRRLV